MSDVTSDAVVGRIVFLSEFGRADAASMGLLRRIAESMRMELVAHFIEDVGLLRAAALPISREVGLVSGMVRAFDVHSVERSLRLQAEQLRRKLAVMAGELQLPWSFDITRGNLAEQALTIAGAVSVVVVGGRSSRIAVRALSPNAQSAQTIAAIYQPGAAGARVVVTAWRLAQRRPESFVMLVPETSVRGMEQLREQIAAQLDTRAQALKVLPYAGSIADLRQLLSVRHVAAVALPAVSREGDARGELQYLLDALDLAVILVA